MTDSSHSNPRNTNQSAIAKIRIARGITQAQLAEMIGSYAQTVSRWENGDRSPNIKMLVKVAKALQCSLDDLV